MSKEITKVRKSLESTLNAIDTHKKVEGRLPTELTLNPSDFHILHAAVTSKIEDPKIFRLASDRGLKVKVDNLVRIKVDAACTEPVTAGNR